MTLFVGVMLFCYLIESLYQAQVPFRKIGSSDPSGRIPSMERSSAPTIKSTWMMESLIPCFWASPASGLPPL